MTATESKLEVGGFAKNKIHGHISFLYRIDIANPLCFDGVIVYNEGCTFKDICQVGFSRLEVDTELEKVPATLSTLELTKGFLNNLNSESDKQIDNLTYVELLYKLNEQEKVLKLSK
jgi:hypothetical protein